MILHFHLIFPHTKYSCELFICLVEILTHNIVWKILSPVSLSLIPIGLGSHSNRKSMPVSLAPEDATKDQSRVIDAEQLSWGLGDMGPLHPYLGTCSRKNIAVI